MTDTSIPSSTAVPWQDKPLVLNDSRQGKQLGLGAFLDRLRQVPYVTGVETTQYHPTLVVASDFAIQAGDVSRLLGWFSSIEDRNTTQFDVLTTARNLAEQRAALADLRQRLLVR